MATPYRFMSSLLDLDFEKYLHTSYAHGKFKVAFGLIVSVFLSFAPVNNSNIIGALPLWLLYGGIPLFSGLREIITARKRYSQLNWAINNVNPTNLQVFLSSSGGRVDECKAELRPLHKTLDSSPTHKLVLVAPVWNVQHLLNQSIQAQVYFHPNPRCGGAIIIENKLFVWLPGSIATDRVLNRVLFGGY
jgi:hypothetical protein